MFFKSKKVFEKLEILERRLIKQQIIKKIYFYSVSRNEIVFSIRGPGLNLPTLGSIIVYESTSNEGKISTYEATVSECREYPKKNIAVISLKDEKIIDDQMFINIENFELLSKIK